MSTPQRIHDAIQTLSALLPNPTSPRVVIGLVGLPGAGKSTWAQRWIDAVNAAHATTACADRPVALALGMDGFHLSRAELKMLPDPQLALARRGAPWTFAPQRLRAHLMQLRATDAHGQPAPMRWPDFDHREADPVDQALDVPPSARLIVVEGLYLLLRDPQWALRDAFDAVWFLDVSRAQANDQLAARHCQAWGWTPTQAQARIAASDALNADIVEATKEWADAWVRPPGLEPG